MNSKHLIIFDMDHTILKDNSDYVILDLLSKESQNILDQLNRKSTNWAKHMQTVYHKMRDENVEISQIKKIIDNCPLNSGFDELFNLIKQNKDKFDCIIVSGANTLFVKWIIEKYNLTDIFTDYFSNIAEPCNENLIKIEQANYHNCETCDESMCKRMIVQDYINNKGYDKLLYLGDGSNDYCPATIFSEKDYLFPREGFPLYNKLYKKNFINQLRCNVSPWKSGHCVIEVLKKLI